MKFFQLYLQYIYWKKINSMSIFVFHVEILMFDQNWLENAAEEMKCK